MKNNSRWLPAAVAVLVVSLVTATFEPSAFCNDAEAKQTSATTPPGAAEPTSATVLIAPARSAAQTVSQSRSPTAAATTPLLPPSNPRARQSPSNKKWIFIIAGAARGGTLTD